MNTAACFDPLFLALARHQDDCCLVCTADGVVLYASIGKAFAVTPALPGSNIRTALQLDASPQDMAEQHTGSLGWHQGQRYDVDATAVEYPGGDTLYLCRVKAITASDSWQRWLETMPLPASIRNKDSQYLWANRHFIEKFSPAGCCIIGKQVGDILCDVDARKTVEADRYALTMNQGVIFEYICSDQTCARGHYIVMQCPVQLPDGTDAVFSVVEEMEKLRTDMPSFQETEIRYRRLARHLLTYLDNHHASLARELHDVAGQTLIGLKLAIHNALDKQGVTPNLADAMQYWQVLLDESIDFIRNFSGSLHPRHLQAFGLQRSLQAWLNQIDNHSMLKIALQIDDHLPALSPELEHACLRIAQEAVTNCLRHAQASSLKVCLRYHDGLLTLAIMDNGKGFCTQEVQEHQTGLGLISMSERAYLSGGKLGISSTPGSGTTITAVWPFTET